MMIHTQAKPAFNSMPGKVVSPRDKMVGLKVNTAATVSAISNLLYHSAPEEIGSFLPIPTKRIISL